MAQHFQSGPRGSKAEQPADRRAAMTDEPIRCIVCEEPIEFVEPGVAVAPLSAVVFKADGNFGSDTYNPLPTERYNTHLRVYLCDRCVEAKSANGLIEMVRLYSTISDKTMTWRPGKSFAS